MRRATLLATAAAAATTLAAARWWRSTRATTPSEPVSPPGHAVRHLGRGARNARLVKVGARAGRDYALHRARRVFADAATRERLDTAFEMRTAAQVAEALGHMKGALMKLGQMASYLDQGLPEHVRAALAELQHNAPPMSPELAAGTIRRELGADPTELFLEWDPHPIASASIGQVHRAITREGRAVAVKVQYPGVEEALGADLDNVGLLFAGMAQLFPGLEHGPLVEELRSRLREELDYRLEAANQRAFARYYDGHPTIHVPEVLDRYSTRRVLTTELAEGVRWDEMLTWDQGERDLAAETIYRFAFGSLYRLHMFNGDPHPGNYLFRPGGRVTFLDFGLVKHFTAEEIQQFEDMIVAMVIDHDPAEFRRVCERIGLLKTGTDFTDEQIVDYFGHFYEFVMHDGVCTITPEYASETVRRFFDKSGPYGEIMKAANVPPSMVIIQRINLGLYALFGEMRATGNWRRLAEEIWPFVAGPPATPMGEEIEAWRARREGAVA
ncbi:ABC1 kinase family protein [Rhabdothermincola sediminis]|uniref:ABC1 kinase family protein n=1 Tax=Rhabdothermincola sediminis TaxID=2751370 RepID=UPI001AA013AF|nr:AarF/ABC1/UbiB kinase family protein [Rhabdothermincola sediminis]